MHSAGARALREDDNEMSREAVLLQWERKIEVAERLDAGERVEPGEGRAPDQRRAPEGGRFAPEGGRFARTEDAHEGGRRFARDEDEAGTPEDSGQDDAAGAAEPVPLHPVEDAPAPSPRRFVHAPYEGGTQSPAQPVAERRTITITGQPTPARRRRAVVDSQLAQPDRIALWAFLLGLLLVAVAAGTAHA
jgi:hypothetical protein